MIDRRHNPCRVATALALRARWALDGNRSQWRVAIATRDGGASRPIPAARPPARRRANAPFRRLMATLHAVTCVATAAPAAGGAADPIAARPGHGMAEYGAAAADRTEFFMAAGIVGTLTRPSVTAGDAGPAVVFVHDSLGSDRRGDAYATQLAAAGFHVLDLLSHPADSDAAGRAAAALARDARVDPARIAALGFGAGGAAVAAAGHPFAARVLLYPGCASLVPAPAAGTAPVMLLHGDGDPANPGTDCAHAASALQRGGSVVKHVTYRGAGYAWDLPAYGAEGRSLVPRPGAEGRVAAVPWPALTAMAAAQVAGFLATTLREQGQ